MKVRVEVIPDLQEEEVILRCKEVTEDISRLYQLLSEQASKKGKLDFYRDGQVHYFGVDNVFFFDTQGEYVYAHTATLTYRVRYRLYELEKELPANFVRASKSAIVNIDRIRSVTKGITSSALVQFSGTEKEVYASRFYNKELRQRIKERSII